MEYGICTLSVIPMRAEANERSEQVSQLLFGETYELLDWGEKWVSIRTSHDRYEGWISRLQVVTLGYFNYNQLIQDPSPITYRPVTQLWKVSDNSTLYLPASSILPFLSGTTCLIDREKYEIIGERDGTFKSIADTAKSYINTPYLWGGRTHFGIDCSGFTQAVLRMHDILILRDASQQATQGIVVDFTSQGDTGDLAFF